MNINQIAMEMYGKYYTDLNPYQQDAVMAEFDRIMSPKK